MSAPSDFSLQEFHRAAVQAAHTAADALRDASPNDIRSKGNERDLVTEFDDKSETILRWQLARSAPGLPFVGEEQGGDATIDLYNDWYWLVDPVDGTVNFAHGIPMWAISIALMHGATPVVGVVCAPAMDWCFDAIVGQGANSTIRGVRKRLTVSTQKQFSKALLATGFPYDVATSNENNLVEWAYMQTHAASCRRFGAASLDLCMVASGWFEGYWERKLKPWDVAAGALIVTEAGGRVTDTTSQQFDPHKGEIIASNGAIHSELVSHLARARLQQS
jgi:myo-inositol-1(or 4)-monophosphatase